MDPIGPDPTEQPLPRWVARLVEAVQPATARADRLGGMDLFDGFRWGELEEFAGLFEEVDVARGARLTTQGRLDSRLWLLAEGEALVSADARPLRVVGPGGLAGVPGMLYSTASPETTIALRQLRAFAAGPAEFRQLVRHPRMRRRLTALAGEQLRAGRLAKLR